MNETIVQQSQFEGLYNPENFLGKGAFGIVYKVTEKKTQKQYAMKILDGQDESLLKDFESEINILSHLNYPLLLSLYGITLKPYSIITEFIQNKSVHYYINLSFKGHEQDEWNLTNKMISIIGIAFGMRYLHSKKIAHRDLKPENILLDSNFYPKICDFGLSKTMNSSKKLKSKAGTPAFCAPEVLSIKDDQQYDGEKADVYSYGMTIYSILYDEIPFSNYPNEYMIIKEVVDDKKRPNLDERFSKSMNNLISRCWDDDPKNRPTFNIIINELLNTIIKENNDIDIVKINELLQFCNESKIGFTPTPDDFDLNFQNSLEHKMDILEEINSQRKDIKDVHNSSIDNEELMNIFLSEYNQDNNYKNDTKSFSLLHYAAKKIQKKCLNYLYQKEQI